MVVGWAIEGGLLRPTLTRLIAILDDGQAITPARMTTYGRRRVSMILGGNQPVALEDGSVVQMHNVGDTQRVAVLGDYEHLYGVRLEPFSGPTLQTPVRLFTPVTESGTFFVSGGCRDGEWAVAALAAEAHPGHHWT
jgi:hypothetical protein